jgi:hypothetical protein
VHTERDVVLVEARLVPPWCDTALFLHEEALSVRVLTHIRARPRLRWSLAAAGFHVTVVRTWLSLGSPRGLRHDQRR